MKLAVFRDGYRYIVGPKEQGCYSMTDGLGEYASLEDAQAAIAGLEGISDECLQRHMRVFWTDERFEEACDAGKFGANWE